MPRIVMLAASIVPLALCGVPIRAAHAAPVVMSNQTACQTAQLRGSIAGQTAGLGNVYTVVALRNVSGQACAIAGYPGVSLVDGADRQIGQPARWDRRPAYLIVLPPGAAASTVVRTANRGAVDEFAHLPAGPTRPVVRAGAPVCVPRHPVRCALHRGQRTSIAAVGIAVVAPRRRGRLPWDEGRLGAREGEGL